MKRIRWTPLAAVLVLAAAWALPGCNTPSSPSADADLLTRPETVNFDDPYGGYNLGDEAPAFGDPVLTTAYGDAGDVEVTDRMVDDPTVVDAERHPHPRRYLMITWGNLRADTSIDFVTDWSGSLTVDHGVAVVRRLVAWDPGDELLERTSPRVIEWISHTKPHFDGVVVALHPLAPRDTAAVDTLGADSTRCDHRPPLSVTFATGPLTITLAGDELVDLHQVIPVDDAGNAVAFNTVTVEPGRCGGGFLAGRWKDAADRPGGRFRGKWISYNGEHMGYLRGVYGVNSSGDAVFFGKWINRGGRFQGLLRGRWGRFDDRPGGWFEGEWINRARRVKGELRGVWRTREDVDGRGYFRGRWRRRCP